MEFGLEDIRPGVQAVVVAIPDENLLQGRLRQFGFTEGTELSCRYRSPGRDLVALAFGGTMIAVRVTDLGGIRCRRCDG